MELKEIERSIIKKYRKTIWKPFVHAINDYNMISENDVVGICISGGKDSFLLAKCIEEIKRHGKIHFNAKFIVMNPGYADENLNKIIENAKKLNIDINIFNSNIFSLINNQENPCYMCAKMRRGYLYSYAKSLGCNKIALGHHFDDVIETILLNIFYGAEYKTMMPKLHSKNFSNMELIRPLYYVREKDIISWSKYVELEFLNCACNFTSKEYEDKSKRKEMKKLISQLKESNPLVETSIFKSSTNVNIDALIGYKKDGIKYSFLDRYDKNEL